MKLFIKIAFALSFLFLVSPSFAGGKYTPGTVYVDLSNPSQQYVIGAFNVRYNPAVTNQSYIQASAGPGLVTFIGVDSTTGQNFSCYVYSSNTSLYPTAIAIATGASNGSVLTINKTSSSALCTTAYVSNSSDHLD